ncbi:dihydrofolate reductase family protein [Sphaerisporangium corydalis]|uniref:Dihydrofolate reductase family protein n=1 Tax=Sphaerisporangium corydalis TaxID=1441875 RepID=A0ABV9ECB2_9ACTN|nr:dihydrofolate reductase family protein [Sphaerisporangium corydalis]
MGEVVVTMNVTLDGVTQSPGRAGEDVRGGFEHGGWAAPYDDEVKGRAMAQGMAKTGAMLFGRRTYEDFFSVWPNRTDNPFTGFLDNVQKYVASTTLRGPLPWRNSTLLDGDAADAVAGLKEGDGPDLAVIGSVELVRSLARRGLVDEYVLLIHPLVLGSGRRLFADGDPTAHLRLVDSLTTGAGVVIATYQPK